MKPTEYVEQVLEQVPSKSGAHHPFGINRGYVSGTIVYKRKDGQLIQKDDLIHLKQLSFGQTHIVLGSPGDFTCAVHYECDSTD